MIVFRIQNDIAISVKEMHSNSSNHHKHYYFELIYIMEGSDVHNINDNLYKFKKGEAFLLTSDIS